VIEIGAIGGIDVGSDDVGADDGGVVDVVVEVVGVVAAWRGHVAGVR
jgi:hypothetical protein